MTSSNLRAITLAVVMTAAALPVLAADDPVIATVNGKDVHLSAVKDAQQAIPQARQLPLNMVYPQLLDHVITGELLLDQAKKLKLEDDANVKAAFKQAQAHILQQAYLSRKVDADITESQMKARYEEVKNTAPVKEEVKARHILVDSEDAAKEVIADLKNGVKFEDEAKAKTKDPSGKSSGGDLGYIGKEDTVPEFSEAAFKLKPGEVTSAPVKTQFGWHVIKVDERRNKPAPTYEEAMPQIRDELARADVQKILDGLQKTAKVKRFNLDGTPMTDAPATKN